MNANFRGKGSPLPKIFGTRKVESLGYRAVKKIAEKFNRLSRVHQRYRQTTDGIATASSEREREFTSAKNALRSMPSRLVSIVTNECTIVMWSDSCVSR